MSRCAKTTFALLLAAACLAAPAAARLPERHPATGPHELIVGFRTGVGPLQRGKALAPVAGRTERWFSRINAAVVRLPANGSAQALAMLAADPRVRYVEQNAVVHAADLPDDPSLAQLWGLDNQGQTVNGVTGAPDADIDASEAWSVTTGSPGVVVGVIDTGVDFGHPDLAANQWINPGEDCPGCRTDGVDNDHNGYVDDWRGWDFVSDDNNPLDDNGHGTHVAGTIGAVGDNGVGVAGVNWNVRIMAVKFLGANGSGTTADAVSAVLYATANGAVVTNNSWSGGAFSQALLDALRTADARGSLFVAAAGNDGRDIDATPAYPASYDVPNVLSVAATDSRDAKAAFSNYGSRSVDLGAPGVNIYSTWTGGTYRFASGTSMATPHVAGAAALVRAAFPGASPAGTKALLLGTADPLPSLAGATASGARLNIGSAVACSDEPEVWVDSPAEGFEADVGESVPVTVVASRCAAPDAVTVSAVVGGSSVTLVARGDGVYTGSFAPAAGGPLSLDVTAEAGGGSVTRSVHGAATQVYPISVGGPSVDALIPVPGGETRAVFDGLAGERVALLVDGVTVGTSGCCSTFVTVLRPDGGYLVGPTFVGTKGGFLDTKALPVGGRYTIVVDAQGTGSGSLTLTLLDVPPDTAGAISPGGSPVAVAATAPGQNAKLTFNGTAGRQVSVLLTDVTVGTSGCCSAKVSISRPDATMFSQYLVSPTFFGLNGGFVDTKLLPATGLYTITVDPQAADTGGATVALYDVPPEGAGSLAVGGSPRTLQLAVPGQNARLTFAGTASQTVRLTVSGVTIGTSSCCSTKVSVWRPDGTKLVSPTYVGTKGTTLTFLLPAAGTYSVLLDPQAEDAGSATLALS